MSGPLWLLLMYVAVQHNVTDDYDAVSGTHLKGHGGADFFAIDAFVHAVSVCYELLSY